jgi:hypothetical protein
MATTTWLVQVRPSGAFAATAAMGAPQALRNSPLSVVPPGKSWSTTKELIIKPSNPLTSRLRFVYLLLIVKYYLVAMVLIHCNVSILIPHNISYSLQQNKKKENLKCSLS